jgi:hypothetical protein
MSQLLSPRLPMVTMPMAAGLGTPLRMTAWSPCCTLPSDCAPKQRTAACPCRVQNWTWIFSRLRVSAPLNAPQARPEDGSRTALTSCWHVKEIWGFGIDIGFMLYGCCLDSLRVKWRGDLNMPNTSFAYDDAWPSCRERSPRQ